MKRDLLRLLALFTTMLIMMVIFGWIEAQVGYERFAWGGIAILGTLAITGLLATIITIRKERK